MPTLFFYLTILNIFDASVTWFGLRLAFITELNPVMNAIYEVNPFLFFLTKLTLSLLLLLFIVFKIVPKSSLVKGVTYFAALLYTVVVLMHGFWLVHVI